jgi:hypothetical protein
VTNQDPFNTAYPGGQTFSDPNVFATCVGGSDAVSGTGEGPCSPQTALCQSAQTQGPTGPVACPVNSAASGALCEFADGSCFQKGSRTANVNGVLTTEVSAANWCNAGRYQNGDLDFDGVDYQPNTWPNGTRDHPTSFQYVGPFQQNGHPYPQVQFETDIGGSSNLCNPATGAGCTAPPISANFYPFWSLSPQFLPLGSFQTSCVWNFGNVLPNTIATFGKDAQYGTPDVARFGGTIISAPMPNPQFTSRCANPFF